MLRADSLVPPGVDRAPGRPDLAPPPVTPRPPAFARRAAAVAFVRLWPDTPPPSPPRPLAAEDVCRGWVGRGSDVRASSSESEITLTMQDMKCQSTSSSLDQWCVQVVRVFIAVAAAVAAAAALAWARNAAAAAAIAAAAVSTWARNAAAAAATAVRALWYASCSCGCMLGVRVQMISGQCLFLKI